MGSRPTIFISSTFSDLRYEREFVADVCDEMGFDVLFFPEHSTAGGGQRDYLTSENDAQILVYLVTRESDAVKEELELAAELGLFVVQLARVEELGDDATAISKFAGSLRHGARYQDVFRTLAELRTKVREGVSEAVARRLSDRGGLAEWSPSSYESAAAIVRATNWRFGLVQDTSSLLLGPRRGRLSEERKFLDSVCSFVSRVVESDSDGPLEQEPGTARWPEVPFIHVFNASATIEAIRSGEYPFMDEFLGALEDFYLPLVKAGRVVICGIDLEVSPILICDDSCEIGTRLADRIYYGRFSAFGSSASRLWGALQETAISGTALDDGWPWHPST